MSKRTRSEQKASSSTLLRCLFLRFLFVNSRLRGHVDGFATIFVFPAMHDIRHTTCFVVPRTWKYRITGARLWRFSVCVCAFWGGSSPVLREYSRCSRPTDKL